MPIGRAAAVVAAIAMLAGCATSGGGLLSSKAQGTTSSGSVPFSDRLSSLFGGSSTSAPAAVTSPATPTSDEFDCPRIDIRQGAATLLVNAPGEPNALTLRYQGSFVRAARECRVNGPNVTIKIGVQGRVILGPAGVPGHVTVPLRYALVSESLNATKAIWSKLYLIPVDIPTQTQNVAFTNISDDLTVPIPSPAELENWVLYIGFDPNGTQQEPKRKGRAAKPRQVQVE
jgi:hypothetical protein